MEHIAGREDAESLLDRPWWYFRMIHYDSNSTTSAVRRAYGLDTSTKVNALPTHTDYGWITMLICTRTNGNMSESKKWEESSLQICDRSGGNGMGSRQSHLQCESQAHGGNMIVNYGDMISAWSHGRIRARADRVRGIGENKTRTSIPFSYNPRLNAVLDLGHVNEMQEMEKLGTYGEHLAKKLLYEL